MVEKILAAYRENKAWRTIVSVLACFTVFATTYSMILPAISLEKSTAENTAGIELEAKGEAAEADDFSGRLPEDNSSEIIEGETPGVYAEETGHMVCGAGAGYTVSVFFEEGTIFSAKDPDEKISFQEHDGLTLSVWEPDGAEEDYKAYASAAEKLTKETGLIPYLYQMELMQGKIPVVPDRPVTIRISYSVSNIPQTNATGAAVRLADMSGQEQSFPISATAAAITFAEGGDGETSAVWQELRDDGSPSVAFADGYLCEMTVEHFAWRDGILALAAADDGRIREDLWLADTLLVTGDDYRVSAAVTRDARIPADAVLVVEEITADREESLLSEAASYLGEEKKISSARFFDISFMAGGKEVLPKASVSVSITFADEVPQESTASVLHFGEEGISVLETADVPDDSDRENAGDEETPESRRLSGMPMLTDTPEVFSDAGEKLTESTVTFETETFSPFGVIYTVDFTYQDYTYSMSGNRQMPLTDLIRALGIEAEPGDIIGVSVVLRESNDSGADAGLFERPP